MAIQTIALTPVVVGPKQSRVPAQSIIGEQIQTKLTGPDSAGRLAVMEITIPVRTGPPEHIHTHEDEWFYVLEGEVTFLVGGQTLVATPGTSAFGPRGVPHTFMNSGTSPARMLVVATPAGFENYFADADREASGMAEPDWRVFQGLMQQYGLTEVGPPLAMR